MADATAIPAELHEVSSNTAAGLLIKLAGLRTRAIHNVRPLNPSRCRFIGPAFTVRYVPIREDLADRSSLANPGNPHHGTIDRVPPGAVLVMDMMGVTTCGALGDVLVAALQARGVAGLVADGAMRDVSAIAEMDIPVFCAGSAPAPSNRNLLAADVQVRIGCGGVMVDPGDIVLADADGVVVIPPHLVAEVATRGARQERVERWIRDRIERGEPASSLYPPTPELYAAYDAWAAAGSPRS